MYKRILSILLAVAVMFGLTACSENTNRIIWGIDAEEEPTYIYSDTVYLASEKLRTLNPILSKDKDMYYISKLVFDSLFVLDEQLVPESRLVSSYSYNDDGTELYISLKKGVKFHDETELTAQDVKFTVEAIQNLARTDETLYSTHVANIKSVITDKDDAYRLTVKFNSPYGAGLENLIFPILPAHEFKNAQSVKNNKNYEMIGSGPYKFNEYLEFSRLVLVPFDNYFGIKAQNKIYFQILPSAGYAANMTDSGDITLFFDDAMNKDSLLSKYELTASPYISNEVEVLGFNMSKDFPADRKVRQAIAYAINTTEILESAYYNNGVICDSIIYPNFYGTGNSGDPYVKDETKAISYLNIEGYRDNDGDKILEDSDGNDVTLRLLVCSDLGYRLKAAEIVKKSLEDVGINVNIAAYRGEAYTNAYYTGDFDIFLGGFTIDERYDLRSLLHSGFGNPVSYNNPAADEILTELQKGQNYTEKYDLVNRLKDTIIVDLPYYALLYKTKGCYQSYYFEGTVNPLFNDIYRNCTGWRCKYYSEESM